MTYLPNYLASYTYLDSNYRLVDSNRPKHSFGVSLAFSSLTYDSIAEGCVAASSIIIYFILLIDVCLSSLKVQLMKARRWVYEISYFDNY
jgi:hypothetical protein